MTETEKQFVYKRCKLIKIKLFATNSIINLGWVSVPLLVKTPLSFNVYLTDLLLVYQSGPSLDLNLVVSSIPTSVTCDSLLA